MHALTLLKEDHKTVEALFKQFEEASTPAKKKAITKKIVKELAVHAAIEEQVFYPAVRAAMEDEEVQGEVLEALEEHHVVKWVLSEIEDLDPEHERFDAKVKVLIENVRHHVKEEEKELFAHVREAMGRKELEQLGAALMAAKKVAPTRPHPRAPDAPPGNILNVGAGLVDRARDAVRGIAKGRRSAAGGRTKRSARSGTRSRAGAR
jgi:hemerythrin superfamily protein